MREWGQGQALTLSDSAYLYPQTIDSALEYCPGELYAHGERWGHPFQCVLRGSFSLAGPAFLLQYPLNGRASYPGASKGPD